MSVDYKSYNFQVDKYLLQLQQEIKQSIRCPQTEKWLRLIARERKRLKSRRFRVAVVGEFKRGKSSFINALLGKRVLPADAGPATAVISRITYGDTPKAYLCYKDGSKKQIELEKLPEYVTKLTAQSRENAVRIQEAVIEYPFDFCRDCADLVDTPGMNDEEGMSGITLSYLERIDLAIAAVSANYPFSETECDFMVKLLENPEISQIIVAVTSIDTVCRQDRERVLENLDKRIKEKVLARLKELHGGAEPVFEKYNRIFADLQRYAVSSVDALRAYETGDYELLEKSGFAKLQRELPGLILSSQNNIVLQKAMTAAARTAGEYLRGDGLVAQSCAEQERAMKQLADSLRRRYGKYNRGAADNVRVMLHRCVGRFRKNTESDLLNGFADCLFSVRKSDAAVRREGILCYCGGVCAQVGEKIRNCLNAELEKVWREEAKKAVRTLCGEMNASLSAFAGYFDRQQEELALFQKDWTAPLMGESAVSFDWSGEKPEGLPAAFSEEQSMEAFEGTISEALKEYCEGRKRELDALCDAAFCRVYQRLAEITQEAAWQTARYEAAAADAVRRLRSDKALRLRLERLYGEITALQERFARESPEG